MRRVVRTVVLAMATLPLACGPSPRSLDMSENSRFYVDNDG